MLRVLLLILSTTIVLAQQENYCAHDSSNSEVWKPSGYYCHLGDSYLCYEGRMRNYTLCEHGCNGGQCLVFGSIWILIVPVIVIIVLSALVSCCIVNSYNNRLRVLCCMRCCKPKINVDNYVL